MQNLVESIHIKFIIIFEKLIQKCDVLKKLYVFLVTYCKRFRPKNP
jgi:hypothetical protein